MLYAGTVFSSVFSKKTEKDHYAVICIVTSWQFLIGRTKKELWKRRVMIRVRKNLEKA